MGQPRDVQQWDAWELEVLDFYPLLGTAWVQRQYRKRGIIRSAYSIRHKASRLKLPRLLTEEFTYASEITAEAGTTPPALHEWLSYRDWRKHCRLLGGRLLVPEIIARYYLHAERLDSRPRGYWGTERTAEYLGLSAYAVRANVPHVQYGRTRYYDPAEVEAYKTMMDTQQPPPRHIPLREIIPPTERTERQAQWFKANGTPAKRAARPTPGGRQTALYVHEDAARQFLSAKGHRAEVVETLIRKAQQVSLLKSQK